MAVPHNVIRPRVDFLWTVFGFTLLSIVVAYFFAWWFSPATGSSFDALLATVITLSGITAPLAIAYLSIDYDKQFIVALFERVVHHLAANQTNTKDLVAAYLFLTHDGADTEASSEIMKVLYEVVHRAENHAADHGLTETAKKRFFRDHVPVFEKYFEHKADRAALLYYIISVGAPAIIAFVLLYINFFNDTQSHKWLMAIEHAIIIFTFAMNIATYIYLLTVIHHRRAVLREADGHTEMLCRDAKNEIRDAARRSKDLEKATAAGLDAKREVANDAGGRAYAAD